MTSKEILQQWEALRPERERLIAKIRENTRNVGALNSEFSELNRRLDQLYTQGDVFYEQYQSAVKKELEKGADSCNSNK